MLSDRHRAFRRSKLHYTGRAFRQDADQAMRSDIMRGLVEAITNSDDAYGDDAGDIDVRISRAVGRTWMVSVRDGASGIRLAEMEKRLATMGARTSGHERGRRVRGNRGRGAKDLAAYGSARWDSIVGDEYGVIEIERDGTYRIACEPLQADPLLRARLGIRQNGTLVTIRCRGNVVRPRFETLVNKLERCVPLRDIMENPRRRVFLSYLDHAPVELRYTPYDGLRTVERATLLVPGYPGVTELTLLESPEPLPGVVGDLYRENGLLVKSGRAVHEASLFGFELDPYAQYFTGEVRWDTIDELLREFDRRDERGREPVRTNPFSMISRTRDGLEKTHPAFEALRAAVDPILAKHVARRREQDADAAAETVDTRRRLNQLSRVITQFRLDTEEDLELALSSGAGGDVAQAPFAIIPPSKRIEAGGSQTFTVLLRRDVVPEGEAPPMVALSLQAEPVGCVDLSTRHVVLSSGSPSTSLADARFARGDMYRGTFAVSASDVLGSATVEASTPGVRPCAAKIRVVEPVAAEVAFEPPGQFCFEHERYTVAPGRRKALTLLAPSELVERCGAHVTIAIAGDEHIALRDEQVVLRRAHAGDWYQGRTIVEGRSEGTSTVVARLGDGLHEASVPVLVGRRESGPSIDIEIGHFEGYQRARWHRDLDGNVTITINATHPAAERYFGSPPEFAGQNSFAARLIVAEIVAEEVVRDLLSRKYGDARVDPNAYASDRLILLATLLPQCHQSQITNAEAAALLRPREREPARRKSATVRAAHAEQPQESLFDRALTNRRSRKRE